MNFRSAIEEDLEAIVAMLADDELGKIRENYQLPLPGQYLEAFKKIQADKNHELIVVEDDDKQLVGTLQLSFLQYLTYRGGIRAQIEAVRIKKELRGSGLGTTMFKWAIERAKQRKAHVLQLTTDKKRPAALEFYKKLGFRPSHEGMKLHLPIE